MKVINIEAETGAGVRLKKGQVIRVIDIEGKQVADLVAINADDSTECLDPGATIDALHSKDIQQGEPLYSNRYQPMLTVMKDMVGKHDLLLPACRPEMYEILYDKREHANCFDNLNKALVSFNIQPLQQHRPFNIFMNTIVDNEGRVCVVEPLSSSGDYIELKAEMDLIVAVSACPTYESACNGYECTGIRLEVLG
ncbi:urea carboxylase-associated family protein [Bacillus timonensis]|nr:urea carboxylase-associated family protein [Bacillus timonensis]